MNEDGVRASSKFLKDFNKNIIYYLSLMLKKHYFMYKDTCAWWKCINCKDLNTQKF